MLEYLKKLFSKKKRLLVHNKYLIELDLTKDLNRRLNAYAIDNRITKEAIIVKMLEEKLAPTEYVKPHIISKGLPILVTFLSRIPSVQVISHNKTHDHYWWIKLNIDINHSLAWSVVQELGFVLNDISLSEKLPTVFMPVSPPPYLNGGPEECLSWVIESRIPYVDPENIARIIEERLPNPVEDEQQWEFEE